jgi:hypothetical protein
VAEGASNEGRDAHGRFAAGNPGGPGGPRRRAHELRRASEEAVTPDHLRALIRKALLLGLAGDLAAIRFVVERTCGRPAEAPIEATPLGFTLPKLQSAADCNAAVEQLMAAFCSGAVDRETAKVLNDTIQTRLKAIELTDVERRLAELEKTATIVKGPRFLRGPQP